MHPISFGTKEKFSLDFINTDELIFDLIWINNDVLFSGHTIKLYKFFYYIVLCVNLEEY